MVDFDSSIYNNIKNICIYEFDLSNNDYNEPFIEIVTYNNDTQDITLYRCLITEQQFEFITNHTQSIEKDDLLYENLLSKVYFKQKFCFQNKLTTTLLSTNIVNQVGEIIEIEIDDTQSNWARIIKQLDESYTVNVGETNNVGVPHSEDYLVGAYITHIIDISEFKENTSVMYISKNKDYAIAKMTNGKHSSVIMLKMQVIFPGDDKENMDQATIKFTPISTASYIYMTKEEYNALNKQYVNYPTLDGDLNEVLFNIYGWAEIGLTKVDAEVKLQNYDKLVLDEDISYTLEQGKLIINDYGDFFTNVQYVEKYDKEDSDVPLATGILNMLEDYYGLLTDPLVTGTFALTENFINSVSGYTESSNDIFTYVGSVNLSNINPDIDIIKNLKLSRKIQLNNLFEKQGYSGYSFKNKPTEYSEYKILVGSKTRDYYGPNKMDLTMDIGILVRENTGVNKNISFVWNTSKIYNRFTYHLKNDEILEGGNINQGGAFLNYQFVPSNSVTYRYEIISNIGIDLYLNEEKQNCVLYEVNGIKKYVFDSYLRMDDVYNAKISFQSEYAVGSISVCVSSKDKYIDINNQYKDELLYGDDAHSYNYFPEYNTTYYIEIISDIPINLDYYDEVLKYTQFYLKENYDGNFYYYSASFNSELDNFEYYFCVKPKNFDQAGSFSFSIYNDVDLCKIKYVNVLDQETIQINNSNIKIYTFKPKVSKNYRIEISNTNLLNVSLYINGNTLDNLRIENGKIYSMNEFSCTLTYRIMVVCNDTCDFIINSGKQSIYVKCQYKSYQKR